MAAPQIQTYHCICTSLLLATTHTLSSLPRRASPSVDSAVILPIPLLPTDIEDETEPESETKPFPATGYTTFVGTTTDRSVTIIRKSDGFEVRKLLRCQRCRLVVGYEIAENPGRNEKEKERDEMKVVYLLPGGVMSTEAMVAGKKITEEQVGLGNEKGVAAWG